MPARYVAAVVVVFVVTTVLWLLPRSVARVPSALSSSAAAPAPSAAQRNAVLTPASSSRPHVATRSSGAPLALRRPHAAQGALRVHASARADVARYALSLDTPLVPGAFPPLSAHVASVLAPPEVPRATFTGVRTGEHTVWGAALDGTGRVKAPVTARAAPNFAVGGTWHGADGAVLVFTPQGGNVAAVTFAASASLATEATYCAQAGRDAACHDGASFHVQDDNVLAWKPFSATTASLYVRD